MIYWSTTQSNLGKRATSPLSILYGRHPSTAGEGPQPNSQSTLRHLKHSWAGDKPTATELGEGILFTSVFIYCQKLLFVSDVGPTKDKINVILFNRIKYWMKLWSMKLFIDYLRLFYLLMKKLVLLICFQPQDISNLIRYLFFQTYDL